MGTALSMPTYAARGPVSITAQHFILPLFLLGAECSQEHHWVVVQGDVLMYLGALELIKAISFELGCKRSYTV